MNPSPSPIRRVQVLWTLLFALIGGGLTWSAWRHTPDAVYEPPPLSTLERIRSSGVLRVATINSPVTWYERHGQNMGMEYDLARRFAKFLDVELEMVVTHPFSSLFDAVDNDSADVAAALITVTEQRHNQRTFGPAYGSVTQQVVYKAGNHRPRSAADLAGKSIVVIAGSSYEETLFELRNEIPDLRWKALKDHSIEDLYAMVDDEEFDLTIADSTANAVHLRFFPTLKAAFDISSEQDIAWALKKNADPEFVALMTGFFSQLEADGALARIKERYHAYLPGYDQVNTHYFLRHIQTRLPELELYFQAAAQNTGIDWRLLAAVAYQESHWRPDAVSPTGVRGVMMLTQLTAREMGVKNRNDPAASIAAGARYLARMKRRIPKRIPEPDRTWMALAAYNVGWGHLEDARILTQRAGDNPDRWADVTRHLPKLSNPAFYSTVKYGYARGREPAHYVRNIRSYYDILSWRLDRETRIAANPADPERPLPAD